MKLPERLSSDLFLVFTSLLIACVIWLIAKGNDREQSTFAVPIVLENKPDNVQVHLPREFANVTVNFPKSLQPHMLSSNFQLILDWNNMPEGSEWIGVEDFGKSPLFSMNPREDVRPVTSMTQDLRARVERHVEFLSVSPGKAFIEAKYLTRPVELAFPTTGKIPDGYRLTGEIAPAKPQDLLLTASPSRFRQLGAAGETSSVLVQAEDSIDLSNRRGSFTQSVRLRIPEDTQILFQEDDAWRVEDQRRIEVRVPIGEIMGRRTIGKVPIQIKLADGNLTAVFAEKLASVSVQGPDRVLQRIKASDLVVRPLNPPEEKPGLYTSVTLQALFSNSTGTSNLAKQTEFISVTPKEMRLQYLWRWRPEFEMDALPLDPFEQSEQ